jgi:transposase
VRTLLRLFRFLVRVQGAVVLGANVCRETDSVEIEVRRRSHAKPRCPRCRRTMGGRAKPRRHRWRHVDLMGVTTYLVADIREARCPRHGRMVERVPWAAPRAQHTKVFDRQVASLAQVADKSATSRMFRISWRTVGRIIERVVGALLPKDRFEGLEAIAVDEVSHKRGHRYLTVVMCLMTGRIVWLGEGRTAETLAGFFRELGEDRAKKINVVAMDMSGGYKKAVEEHAPNADVVYDRFHVVKLLLDAVDEVRREECRRVEGSARKALKHSRFALLRNPKFRTPRDSYAIQRIACSNRRLTRAYELRVSFEDLWECETEQEAREFVDRWTRAAMRTRLAPLKRVAKTIRDHVHGILGFFRHYGQTSAPLEGTNNKIKLLIHRAFGFQSVSALIAMIFLCCSHLDLSRYA